MPAFTDWGMEDAEIATLLLLFTFFNPRVLRAHGGADYTFGAFAILVVLPPGKKPSRAQLCARSVPVTAIRLPPGSTAFIEYFWGVGGRCRQGKRGLL